MKPEIYLIGTNHFDLKGPARLEKLLDHLQPEYILVEFDKLRAWKAEQMEETLQSQEGLKALVAATLCFYPTANPETVRETIKTGNFEYLTARDYSWQKGIPNSLPLILADSAERVAKLNGSEEVYRETATDLSMSISELTETIEQGYREDPLTVPSTILNAWDLIARDTYAEKKLRRLARKVAFYSKIKEFLGKKKPDRIVYIGGLLHSFGDYHNLFERLSDLGPVRIKLNKADRL